MIPTEWAPERVRDVVACIPVVDKGFSVLDGRRSCTALRERDSGRDTAADLDGLGTLRDPTQRWPAVERAIEAGRRAKRLLAE